MQVRDVILLGFCKRFRGTRRIGRPCGGAWPGAERSEEIETAICMTIGPVFGTAVGFVAGVGSGAAADSAAVLDPALDPVLDQADAAVAC